MKVILTTGIDSLGLEGDKVNVAKGYARNYLIPKGFALEATMQNIKKMEMQKKKIDERKLKAKENAEQARDLIKEKVIVQNNLLRFHNQCAIKFKTILMVKSY